MHPPPPLRNHQSLVSQLGFVQREGLNMETPVCPIHIIEMENLYQVDLGKYVWVCPKIGCKERYVEGGGHITTDEIPPRRP